MCWFVLGPVVPTERSQEAADRIVDAMMTPVQINVLDQDDAAKQLFRDYDLLVTVKVRPCGLIAAPGSRDYHVGTVALRRRVQMFRAMQHAALVMVFGTPSNDTVHTLRQTLRRVDDVLVVDAERDLDKIETLVTTLTTETS